MKDATFFVYLIAIGLVAIISDVEGSKDNHHEAPYVPPWAPEGTGHGQPKKEGLTNKLVGLLGGKENNKISDYRYMSDHEILFSLCKKLSASACNKFVLIARERYPYEAASVVNAIRNKRPEESAYSTAASEFFKKVVKKHLLAEMFKKPKPHEGQHNYNQHNYNPQNYNPQNYNPQNHNQHNYNPQNYNQHQEDANWLHNQEVEARNHYQNAMNNYRNQQINNPFPTYNGAPIYPSPFPNDHHHH